MSRIRFMLEWEMAAGQGQGVTLDLNVWSELGLDDCFIWELPGNRWHSVRGV